MLGGVSLLLSRFLLSLISVVFIFKFDCSFFTNESDDGWQRWSNPVGTNESKFYDRFD